MEVHLCKQTNRPSDNSSGWFRKIGSTVQVDQDRIATLKSSELGAILSPNMSALHVLGLPQGSKSLYRLDELAHQVPTVVSVQQLDGEPTDLSFIERRKMNGAKTRLLVIAENSNVRFITPDPIQQDRFFSNYRIKSYLVEPSDLKAYKGHFHQMLNG